MLAGRRPPARRASGSWLGENHLPHVNGAGAKTRLAIGEVIFPQAAETLVEAERRQLRPGDAETVAPMRKRDRVIMAEDALARERQAMLLAHVAHDCWRRQHAAGKHVAADEIDLALVALEER